MFCDFTRFYRRFYTILGSKTADDVVFGQNSSMERTWRAGCTSKPLHRANLLPQHCSRQSFEPESHVQSGVRPYRKHYSGLTTAVQTQQTTDESNYFFGSQATGKGT